LDEPLLTVKSTDAGLVVVLKETVCAGTMNVDVG
jgi:hypothetical protein